MLNIIQDIMFLGVLICCVAAKILDIKKGPKKEITNDSIIQKYGNIIFFIILFLSIISISYKIWENPAGLHVDEAGALYDAICISEYGVDRYLYKLPVYFINFGGGQNALYTYLAAIMIKIFGASTLVFRLPSIILSTISMVCLYKIVSENNSKKEALFTTFILAVSPWFIMKSRWGLESYLMCSMLTISSFTFIKALNFQKTKMYILSGILFGLTLYTYAIAYLVVPAIIGITLIYMLINKKIKIKNIIAMAIPLAILGIPLVLMLAYNSGLINHASIPVFSIPKLWFYRGGEISLSNIPENFKNIFEILFIKDFLNYNAIEEFGTLYKCSIGLVIFGIIEALRNAIKEVKHRDFGLDTYMLITFFAVFFTGLCVAELNINKINAIYIPMIYFAGKFLYFISQNIKFGGFAIIAIFCINAGMFLNYYFTDYTKVDLMYFEQDIIEASEKAEELKKEKIYVENCLNQTYIYTLLATLISPYEFNESVEINNGIVTKYGKYHFEISENIENEAVYVIKNDTNKISQLVNAGFEMEKVGEFNVLWKK